MASGGYFLGRGLRDGKEHQSGTLWKGTGPLSIITQYDEDDDDEDDADSYEQWLLVNLFIAPPRQSSRR